MPDGPRTLAEECRSLLRFADATTAYRAIAAKFADPDGFGPATVRRFLADRGGMGDMDLEDVQTDAWLRVTAWADALFGGG